jgi:hypothetical protein
MTLNELTTAVKQLNTDLETALQDFLAANPGVNIQHISLYQAPDATGQPSWQAKTVALYVDETADAQYTVQIPR